MMVKTVLKYQRYIFFLKCDFKNKLSQHHHHEDDDHVADAAETPCRHFFFFVVLLCPSF